MPRSPTTLRPAARVSTPTPASALRLCGAAIGAALLLSGCGAMQWAKERVAAPAPAPQGEVSTGWPQSILPLEDGTAEKTAERIAQSTAPTPAPPPSPQPPATPPETVAVRPMPAPAPAQTTALPTPPAAAGPPAGAPPSAPEESKKRRPAPPPRATALRAENKGSPGATTPRAPAPAAKHDRAAGSKQDAASNAVARASSPPARPASAASAAGDLASGRWAVQVGVFLVPSLAERLRAQVERRLAQPGAGVAADERVTRIVRDEKYSRVVVGSFADKAAAQAAAARVRRTLKQDVVLYQR
ncbi:MAG TPA: SPOR domain-containing protein [Burkholderiaceae bacterium]|nr:SPOR domain-containing protein [Burkholderiaceae bacterium]